MGPKASSHILQVRKTPEKTIPRKLVTNGDRTRARCVTGAHAATCTTAVVIILLIIIYINNNYYYSIIVG